MARIVGVDLPKNKRMEIALTYIYGIGRSNSRSILQQAGIHFDTTARFHRSFCVAAGWCVGRVIG